MLEAYLCTALLTFGLHNRLKSQFLFLLKTLDGQKTEKYVKIMVKISQMMEGDEMENRSISDIIEAYLKEIFGDDTQIEIRRSEIADHFNVVPSQINYVIKTRFTIQNGYLVQSKRGGGGYIRIERVNLLADVDVLNSLVQAIGDSIRERDAFAIIETLYNEKVISQREDDLMLVALSKQTLAVDDTNMENKLRARILVSFLNRLRYES